MIDPTRRLTMAETKEHPWVLERKFDAAGSDQGSYNVNELVGEDGPIYRGMGGRPAFDFVTLVRK